MSEQTEPRKLRFSPPSHQSLYLELLFDDQKLSTGTGFVVFASSGPVLLTNRHIVTGKNNITDEHLDKENLSEPNQVRIWHSAYEEDSNEVPIRWTSRVEPLRTEDNDPLWREHPTLGPKGDFVALPLTQHAHTSLFPYGLKPGMPTIIEEHEILNNVDIRVGAGSIVSVVGFPFGLTGAGSLGGRLPIWLTGFIATEPDLDYDRLPMFLIDCRTRKGNSGSPVIAHRDPGPHLMDDGTMTIWGTPVHRMMGIYSGRMNEESDIGMVWKASALQELIESIK